MTLDEAFSKENNVGYEDILEFPLTARIGFDDHDETEFDAETYEDLVDCWEVFCKENNFSDDSIDYIDILDYQYDLKEPKVGEEIVKNGKMEVYQWRDPFYKGFSIWWTPFHTDGDSALLVDVGQSTGDEEIVIRVYGNPNSDEYTKEIRIPFDAFNDYFL